MASQNVAGTPSRELVEAHSIDHIPESERHGRPRDLFTFWYAQNQQVLTLATGSIAAVLGLNLTWSFVAVLVGNLVGTVFAAYHSAQGPQLGVPQMIQTRAQFGFYGGFLFFFATFFLQFGFFASASTLAGASLDGFSEGLGTRGGILVIAVPILLLAVFGYRWLHSWQKGAAVVLTLAFAAVTALSVARGGLPADAFSLEPPPAAPFMAATAIMAVYAISWAPFVADYSRYLPKRVGVARTFWHTYAGIVVACIWLETLGAALGLQFTDLTSIEALEELTGAWFLLIIALSMVGAAASNLYGGMLALVSMLSTWRTIRPSRLLRVAGVAVTAAVGLTVAVAGSEDFLHNFESFLLVLLFVFVPWTAVNLTDFYLVRRGAYDIRSLFTPAGEYGGVSWRGMTAYFVGLGLSAPFLNSDLWVGPLAEAMGGADFSWLIGLVVPAVLYWFLTPHLRRSDVPVRKASARAQEPT